MLTITVCTNLVASEKPSQISLCKNKKTNTNCTINFFTCTTVQYTVCFMFSLLCIRTGLPHNIIVLISLILTIWMWLPLKPCVRVLLYVPVKNLGLLMRGGEGPEPWEPGDPTVKTAREGLPPTPAVNPKQSRAEDQTVVRWSTSHYRSYFDWLPLYKI